MNIDSTMCIESTQAIFLTACFDGCRTGVSAFIRVHRRLTFFDFDSTSSNSHDMDTQYRASRVLTSPRFPLLQATPGGIMMSATRILPISQKYQ